MQHRLVLALALWLAATSLAQAASIVSGFPPASQPLGAAPDAVLLDQGTGCPGHATPCATSQSPSIRVGQPIQSPTAPATGASPFKFQAWWNTSVALAPVLEYYDGSSWDPIGTLDLSNHVWLPGGVVNQPLGHTFWGGPLVKQDRFADRVFIGGAVADSGFNTFPQTDWLSQLTLPGQGFSPFGTGVFATLYVLTDPSAAAGTPANIGTPTQAIMAGNSSLNGISTGPTTYSTPRTIECAMVNNILAAPTGGGPEVPAWCIYLASARTSANSGQTYGAEFEISNFVSAVTGWTPESTAGVGSIALELGSGGGLDPTGQFSTTVALYISRNPTQFGAGILMLDNAIGAYGPVASPLPAGAGPGATITGLGLKYNQEIQFYHTGLQGRIFGDSSDNMNILSGSGQLKINSILSSIGNNAVLNAPAGFVATLATNGVSGVGYNGSNFSPITTTTTTLGDATHVWGNAYIDTISSVGTNLELNAPTGTVVLLAVNGVAGVDYNGSNFSPIITNTVTLGDATHEFNVGYIKTLVTDSLPTSAGAGGLYVCVDNVGVQYKKAVCP